ncbi:MAG: nucleoside-diphosphate sugar epimerase/dehydratase [Bacteroidetes bacterium]|nr:nucleoside-diphosphate sugar epimerase/dehydratase [Bacteroidota bacterium]
MNILSLRRNTPRGIIWLIDMLIVLGSVILAYLLRFNFDIPPSEIKPFPVLIPWILAVRGISFLISRTHAGLIRYTSTADGQRVLLTLLIGSLVFGLTNIFTWLTMHWFMIPTTIIMLEFLITTLGMILFRTTVKIAWLEFQNPGGQRVDVIIYGAGEEGINAKHVMDRDAATRYKVIAFIDEDKGKQHKKLEGADIYPPSRLASLLRDRTIAQLVLAYHPVDPAYKQELVDLCLKYDTKVLAVPPAIQWVNGQLSFSQIRQVNIEDLLERDVIELDTDDIRQYLHNKVVMITGAAGSIGSEIVRQVAGFLPARMILIDYAETPIHSLELDCKASYKNVAIDFILGNVCNVLRMKSLFEQYKPEIIFHAAAYKHVPVQEAHPGEAIFTNVHGTRVMADLAMEFGVKKFIMISTDKAVNPTSVMGASKRIAEIYCQAMNSLHQTSFITTRFGNVLGSNGSVIPLFRQQIEKGGPVTVTHPEVIRYFMTIPEACRLVLEAGAMGKGGEIFIFDMGKPVRIVDLAKRMIQLSGLEEGKDIQIEYTGLRPGEKLYEELLNLQENTMPTHHPLIMIAKVREYDIEQVREDIDGLVELTTRPNDMEIVRRMKFIVPEYKSQNSVYEALDKP